MEGPTQAPLPGHAFTHRLQLALIDGPHGCPFPNLEYYSRISDLAVVPYPLDYSPRPDFAGCDERNATTEGDTLWVKKKSSHFSSRSTGS